MWTPCKSGALAGGGRADVRLRGLFDPAGDPPEREWLTAAAGLLAHRGPDDAGFLTEPGVGLAFRRLSIVDLAGGHQPLPNEDGTVRIVYNGEVYNHEELRRELEALGHRFRTRCDTEAILHAYEQWGEELRKAANGAGPLVRVRFASAKGPHKVLFAFPGVRRSVHLPGLSSTSRWATRPRRPRCSRASRSCLRPIT